MAKTWLVLGAVLLALSVAAWHYRDPCPRVANEAARQGWAAYRTGAIDSAQARFRAAAASCPSHLDAHSGLGFAELRLGRPDSARAQFEWILAHDSNAVDALVGDGVASYQLGELERARERLTRARELAPERPDIREHLARMAAGAPAAPGAGPQR